jgi:hypothetical protein
MCLTFRPLTVTLPQHLELNNLTSSPFVKFGTWCDSSKVNISESAVIKISLSISKFLVKGRPAANNRTVYNNKLNVYDKVYLS